MMMPAIFFGHDNPTNAISTNACIGRGLGEVVRTLAQRLSCSFCLNGLRQPRLPLTRALPGGGPAYGRPLS